MRLAAFLLCLFAATAAFAQHAPGPLPDGMIVASRAYDPPIDSYEALVARLAAQPKADPSDPDFDETAFRRARPPELFDALQRREIRAERIIYASDGLKIEGYVVRPSVVRSPAPVVIYARGGNGAFGEIGLVQVLDMAGWARRGYVVLATNYRGSSGSEGRDEYGGADVADLLALLDVARQVEGADMGNVFLIGVSRGGMMVYRALAEGAPVRAAAVIGGLSDLESTARERPRMLKLFRGVMPDFEAEQASSFCRRSAVCWPRAIAAPVLILHGSADRRVGVGDARRLAEAMREAGREVELVEFDGGDHGLSRSLTDAWDRTFKFFEAHRAQPTAP